MAQPAAIPPPVTTAADPRQQAREWSRKISASEKAHFLERAMSDRNSPPRGNGLLGANNLRKRMLRIVDLYPWPSSEALRTAAEARLRRIVCGEAAEVSPADAYELIRDLLEDTDALLR